MIFLIWTWKGFMQFLVQCKVVQGKVSLKEQLFSLKTYTFIYQFSQSLPESPNQLESFSWNSSCTLSFPWIELRLNSNRCLQYLWTFGVSSEASSKLSFVSYWSVLFSSWTVEQKKENLEALGFRQSPMIINRNRASI